jgi:hypothetical protein
MTYAHSLHPTVMTGLRPTAMTSRAAQWVGLLMLFEVSALIILICLG